MSNELSAEQFVEKLQSYSSTDQRQEDQPTPNSEESDKFIGVRMGQVFALAKEFIEMPLGEIEKLLESPIHKARVGAVSIMDFQARSKKTSAEGRKALFELYIRRHDEQHLTADRSAIYVVGGYLFDKPRDILYKLARSKDIWERRTAMVSTGYFIRQRDVDDTFKIAEILLNDKEDLIHKATGWMLRAAGDVDRQKLIDFLEKYAAKMPRTALRYAIEHFEQEQRDYYLGMKKKAG
jgi:3-methyladenine DNA glycosylase AlkD